MNKGALPVLFLEERDSKATVRLKEHSHYVTLAGWFTRSMKVIDSLAPILPKKEESEDQTHTLKLC